MKKSISLIIILIVATSCEKSIAPLTEPVYFTTTEYQNLSSYDSTGTPTKLETRENISSNTMTYLKSTLPEGSDLRKVNSELLSSKAIADIAITQPSDVFITFVSQGSGLANTVGFYTYSTNNPPATPKDIKTITYVFPNAGYGTRLQAGDRVKIGRFEAGVSVGLVLLQNGWNNVTKQLNSSAVHFLSNDILNPEVDPALKKHAVLINYSAENKILIGFEDIDRTNGNCDHDFNDVIIYSTVTP